LSVAVVAEKPSVADLARVLVAEQRSDGCLRGAGWIVTWAIGHLAALAEPHEIRPEWRAWRQTLLPMIPERWPLVVYERTRSQFEVVKRILRDPEVERVVCATDAGREGELIFRYVFEAAGATKPVERLWISSLTPDAIRAGFARLRPQGELDGLADAARGRSRADWLVGMNLSRAYTLARRSASRGELLSVGRVQTPTLALLVERELAIRKFVPEEYCEVWAEFRAPGAGDGAPSYRGTWFRPAEPGAPKADADTELEARERARRLPGDGEEAERIAERVRGGQARVESVDAQTRRLAPPQLFDLTELQRVANRRFGFSAAKTLELAQSLYESKKVLSYPRTDSRHLSHSVAATLPKIVARSPSRTASCSRRAPASAARPALRRRRQARRPPRADPDGREPGERAALARRGEAVRPGLPPLAGGLARGPRVRVDLGGDRGGEPRTGARGRSLRQPRQRGRARRLARARARHGAGRDRAPAGSRPASPRTWSTRRPSGSARARRAASARRACSPRWRPRAATSTTASWPRRCARRARHARDPRRSSRPARAQVHRARRQGAGRDGQGIELIQIVHPDVKSAAMTGAWEARLAQIERGNESLDAFLRDIERYVTDV
jgi:DNA topoisomerase-3